jgi:hypothetical protein
LLFCTRCRYIQNHLLLFCVYLSLLYVKVLIDHLESLIIILYFISLVILNNFYHFLVTEILYFDNIEFSIKYLSWHNIISCKYAFKPLYNRLKGGKSRRLNLDLIGMKILSLYDRKVQLPIIEFDCGAFLIGSKPFNLKPTAKLATQKLPNIRRNNLIIFILFALFLDLIVEMNVSWIGID